MYVNQVFTNDRDHQGVESCSLGHNNTKRKKDRRFNDDVEVEVLSVGMVLSLPFPDGVGISKGFICDMGSFENESEVPVLKSRLLLQTENL